METNDKLSRLIAAAERAQAGYHHEEAIAIYTEALEIAPLGDDAAAVTQRYELLFGRGHCYEWKGKAPLAMADFETAVQLMVTMPSNDEALARQADALNRLANLTTGQIGTVEAEKLAEQALTLARQVADTRCEAASLDILAGVQIFKGGSISESVELYQQALNLFRQIGDEAGEALVLYRLAFAQAGRDSSQANIDLVRQAVALARQIGNREIEARALSVLGSVTLDLAQKRTYYERALVLAQSVGRNGTMGSITNNLAQNCSLLGLYRRGLAYADLFLIILSDSPGTRGFYADIYGLNALGLGLVNEAEAAWLAGLQVSQEINAKGMEYYSRVGLGLVALTRDQADEARQIFGDLIGELRQSDSAILSHALAWLAAAHLALNEIEEAKSTSAESVQLFEAGVLTPEYSPSEIWWHRYRVLDAAGLSDGAWEALDRARVEMLETVINLSDEGLRRNYFSKVAVNRDILRTWLEEAGARDLPLKPLTDGLSGASDLQEQFRRLNEIGVRLNTRRGERDLPTFVLDELVELTGAEEAAVLLLDEAGHAQVAAADLSNGRAETLIDDVAQVLDETGLKRQPLLSYSPDDVNDLDQTSILCVPTWSTCWLTRPL